MIHRWFIQQMRGYARCRRRPDYAGNAGMIATVAVAFGGVFFGAVAAYLSERGAIVAANPVRSPQGEIDPDEPSRQEQRADIIAQIISGEYMPPVRPIPERLAPPEELEPKAAVGSAPRPKVIIIIDDMGVDRRASERAIALPGPLTYSFLPYARDVQETVDKARKAGGEIMLHLPMEPRGDADPGPHALRSGVTGGAFLKDLEWNLNRFKGYDGVNNHMGSRLTSDVAAMKTLLAQLEARELFFLDSLTTDETAVSDAARQIGVDVFTRDVFLDAAVGDRDAVRGQLALVENIARETGYAVAIGHPRPETLDVLGPWLTSAPARGFELALVSDLHKITKDAAPEEPTLRM